MRSFPSVISHTQFVQLSLINVNIFLFGIICFLLVSLPHHSIALQPLNEELTQSRLARRLGLNSRSIIKTFDDEIPVVICSDGEDGFRGLLALLLSFDKNSTPETLKRITFFIIVSKKNEHKFLERIQCYFGSQVSFRWHHIVFDESLITAPIVVRKVQSQRLKSKLNYARFYFHKILPETLKNIIYIDHDCLVVKDIADLYDNSKLNSRTLLEAVPRRKPAFDHYFVWSRNERMNQFSKMAPTFNAGVFTMNLEAWRTTDLLDQVHFWMEKNANRTFYNFGTNPLMLLVFYEKWGHLDQKWNVDGLGFKMVSHGLINNAHILHWSGPQKPWEKNGLHVELWQDYHKAECFP